MPERTLYLAADPIQAYVTVRDRHIEPWAGTDEVQLLALRGACPGGTAVGIVVDERDLREVRPGTYAVDREKAEQGITRAYQPWHVDVERDEGERWKGYLDPTYSLTLRNLLDEQTPMQLRAAEDNRVEARMIQLDADPLPVTLDLDHLRAIHGHLFQDVYPWAGETRTVDMLRPGGPWFTPWAEIEPSFAQLAQRIEAQDGLRGLDPATFAERAAEVYNDVNTIHAFREGNGRSQRVWMDDLARGAGYELEWTKVTGLTNNLASQSAREGDLAPLHDVFRQITSPLPEQAPQAVPAASSTAAADLARQAFGTPATDATKGTTATPEAGPRRPPPGRMSDRAPGLGD